MSSIDWSVAAQSAALLLREGLEAILVLAALAAFLRRSGAVDALRWLHGGAAVAVVASLAAAWAFQRFFGGVHNDLLEAAIMIVAAGLMFYMSGWLVLRQDPRAWQADLRERAARALDGGAVWSIAGVAFLAVFREGAETILFLAALSGGAGATAGMAAGLAAAGAGLLLVYWLIERTALRLPLRPVFLATSAFLFLAGVKLVGDAVQELQEQAILPFDTDAVSSALKGFGTNGSTEALLLQVGLIAAAFLCYLLALRPRLQGRRAAAPS